MIVSKSFPITLKALYHIEGTISTKTPKKNSPDMEIKA
jgi:hypothetical protein